MNPLLNLPLIGKYKAYAAGAALMLAGLSGALHSLGDFSTLLIAVLEMKVSVLDFIEQAPRILEPATNFLLGYGVIGVRHAQDKNLQPSPPSA